MRINLYNINKTIKQFNNKEELLDYIKDTIYYLYTHNKNYTQQQWIKIQDLLDIFDNIEVE